VVIGEIRFELGYTPGAGIDVEKSAINAPLTERMYGR
jgi:hypothetical protein